MYTTTFLYRDQDGREYVDGYGETPNPEPLHYQESATYKFIEPEDQ